MSVGLEDLMVVERVPPRHRFRSLRLKEVVPETADAVSIVFDIPIDEAHTFTYRPGQFITLHVSIDGVDHFRSYSMSSTPGLDPDLQVTVKRVPGGLVSNWLNDHLRAGDRLEVSPPAGSFVVDGHERELVAFAAGSGITPVFSVVRDVLGQGDRPVRLLYANRDRASTIFAAALDQLARTHGERFALQHHADAELGFLSAPEVESFVGARRDAEFFICGPGPFMDVVEASLRGLGVDERRIHLERFTPLEPDDEPDTSAPEGAEVTIRLGSQTVTASHRPGTTLLQTARSAGLRAPSSCQTGSCATCMARLTEGQVTMRHNEALTPDEVADGWILTCQAEPVTPTISVVYE